MTIRRNNFNYGVSGGSITTSNSGGNNGNAFNEVAGGPTYTATNATGGRAPLVARMPDGAELKWNWPGSSNTFYFRLYIYLTSYPSDVIGVFYAGDNSGSDVNCTISIDNNGKVYLTDGLELSEIELSQSIPLNQWVRLEGRVTAEGFNGSAELRMYQADSATPFSTGSMTEAATGSSAPDQVIFYSAGGLTFFIDDVGVSDEGWMGPAHADVEVNPSSLTASYDVRSPSVTTNRNAPVDPAALTVPLDIPEPDVQTADKTTITAPGTLTVALDQPEPEIRAFGNVIVNIGTPLLIQGDVWEPSVGVPTNPGDRITAPGQIEWNGFLLGAGTPYRIQQIDGWITDMPGLDSGNVPQPSRHGSWSGRKLSQERIVTVTGFIRARREEMPGVVQDLINATALPLDDIEYPLAIRVLDDIYVGYGVVSRRAIPVDRNYRLGLAKMTLQWTMSDPVLLSRELSSAVIPTQATVTVTNLGNTVTYPVVRMRGPASNPAIEVAPEGGEERVLEFRMTVPSGQLLEIDCYYGTVRIGDTNAISNLSPNSVPITDFVIPAGTSEITYDGGASAPPAEVLWRHAYL